MAQKVPNPLAALRRDGYLFSSSRSPLSITAPVVFESSIRFCFFMTLTTYQIRVELELMIITNYSVTYEKYSAGFRYILIICDYVTSDSKMILCASPSQVLRILPGC